MPAHAQVARDRPREAQRILLRPHPNHLPAINHLRKNLHRQLHRIAHDDISGIRQMLRTQLRRMPKHRQVDPSHLSPVGTSWRQRRARHHHHKVRIGRRDVRKHIDQHTMIVKGVHQVHADRAQPPRRTLLAMPHELNAIERLQQIRPKNMRAQCAAHSARSTQDCDSQRQTAPPRYSFIAIPSMNLAPYLVRGNRGCHTIRHVVPHAWSRARAAMGSC